MILGLVLLVASLTSCGPMHTNNFCRMYEPVYPMEFESVACVTEPDFRKIDRNEQTWEDNCLKNRRDLWIK